MKILDSWYSEKGPDNDVVLYTKTSISRNISKFLFPNSISLEDSTEVLNLIFSFFDSLDNSQYFKKVKLREIDALALKLLEERSVFTNNMPDIPEKAVVIHDGGALYIAINTADHINIVSFAAGCDLENSYSAADSLELQMQEKLLFSAMRDYGYITSDIMGIGSGIRFSSLNSLPSLLYLDKISLVVELAKKAGLIVSGYYVQNSKDSVGALFSIANEISAGGNESVQMTDFLFIIKQIIKLEKEAREEILQSNLIKIQDIISKAFAVSQSAKLMSFKEALDIIFRIKFGLNLNLLKGITNEKCNEILFKVQSGHLAFLILDTGLESINQNFTEFSIEETRANVIKEICKKVKLNF